MLTAQEAWGRLQFGDVYSWHRDALLTASTPSERLEAIADVIQDLERWGPIYDALLKALNGSES